MKKMGFFREQLENSILQAKILEARKAILDLADQAAEDNNEDLAVSLKNFSFKLAMCFSVTGSSGMPELNILFGDFDFCVIKPLTESKLFTYEHCNAYARIRYVG